MMLYRLEGQDQHKLSPRECSGVVSWLTFEVHPALPLNPQKVLRLMGYGPHRKARAPLVRVTEQMCAQADACLHARVVYRRLAVQGWIMSQGELVLEVEGSRRFRGGDGLASLRDCPEIIVFVLSLGLEFEGLQQALRATQQTLESFVLDTAGWLAVEQTTAAFKRHLVDGLTLEGASLTQRFGPGYIHQSLQGRVVWPLEDQEVLFSCFEPATGAVLPASLLPGTFTMQPQMSRSGLYGIRRLQ